MPLHFSEIFLYKNFSRIIIIIIIITTYKQNNCNYVPETNLVSGVYSFAAILCLECMVHVMLFSMLNVLYFHVRISRSTVCAAQYGHRL